MGYSYAQLEGFWINAGGPPSLAPAMAAVAMAESGGGNVIQQGQPYSTTGWGLWQITPGNSESQCGTDAALLNPATNACAAVAKYNSQGTGAWTTYTSGKYRGFLQLGVTPDLSVSAKTTAPSGGGGGGGSGAPTDPLKACFWGITVPTTAGFVESLVTFGLAGGQTNQLCFITKGQVKAITSAVAIGTGAAFFGFGMVMLAAYGYDHSGARQAVNRTARTIGIGTSLLAGQPEVAAGLAATGRGGRGRRRQPRTVGLGSGARPPRPSTNGATPRVTSRGETREIERQFSEMQRQMGPIGPRGGVASRRRERSRPGVTGPPASPYGTPPGEQERRRREGFGNGERISTPRQRAGRPI